AAADHTAAQPVPAARARMRWAISMAIGRSPIRSICTVVPVLDWIINAALRSYCQPCTVTVSSIFTSTTYGLNSRSLTTSNRSWVSAPSAFAPYTWPATRHSTTSPSLSSTPTAAAAAFAPRRAPPPRRPSATPRPCGSLVTAAGATVGAGPASGADAGGGEGGGGAAGGGGGGGGAAGGGGGGGGGGAAGGGGGGGAAGGGGGGGGAAGGGGGAAGGGDGHAAGVVSSFDWSLMGRSPRQGRQHQPGAIHRAVRLRLFGHRHRLDEHRPCRVGQRDAAGVTDRGRTHLPQRLRHHLDGAVVAETRDEVRELGLHEHQAPCILVRLHVGVAPESLLADELLHPRDRLGRVARRLEDRRDLRGVLPAQRVPPPQVSGATVRVLRPGDRPSPQVVGAGGEQLFVACRRVEHTEPLRHQLGVGLLLRPALATDHDRLGIAGVGRVDRGDRPRQTLAGVGHDFGRRSMRRINTPSSRVAVASPIIAKS